MNLVDPVRRRCDEDEVIRRHRDTRDVPSHLSLVSEYRLGTRLYVDGDDRAVELSVQSGTHHQVCSGRAGCNARAGSDVSDDYWVAARAGESQKCSALRRPSRILVELLNGDEDGLTVEEHTAGLGRPIAARPGTEIDTVHDEAGPGVVGRNLCAVVLCDPQVVLTEHGVLWVREVGECKLQGWL